MNDDRGLLDALRALASEGPREAPPEVEERLKREFLRINRRRNLVTWVPAFSAAAALAIGLLIWTYREQPKPAAVVSSQAAASIADDENDAGFYPLPEAEALPALENAMVIRVQLPVSSLQLMGVPVTGERAGASVDADLLLGQDGLARAVRLAE